MIWTDAKSIITSWKSLLNGMTLWNQSGSKNPPNWVAVPNNPTAWGGSILMNDPVTLMNDQYATMNGSATNSTTIWK